MAGCFFLVAVDVIGEGRSVGCHFVDLPGKQ